MLNQPIKTIDDGRKFIQFLDKNGLMFHLDDDVDNIIWCKDVDKKTIKLIGKRHKELWNIGNPWKYAEEIIDIILQGETNGKWNRKYHCSTGNTDFFCRNYRRYDFFECD